MNQHDKQSNSMLLVIDLLHFSLHFQRSTKQVGEWMCNAPVPQGWDLGHNSDITAQHTLLATS